VHLLVFCLNKLQNARSIDKDNTQDITKTQTRKLESKTDKTRKQKKTNY